ncbi:MAG: winged helix-turn-helix transcriptional regulator [Gammaproteobacteria bacterium]|nr:winged helix-turn-helix transcriptional regulator [Gammaproteobacteria bacterium]
MNSDDKEDALTLEILETIENDSAVTQRHLAANLGVALGLANSYLRRCARKGLIKVHQAPANRYLYYLTPKGFAEKSRLTAKYLSSSFEFYRRAGDACRAVYQRCREHGWRRIVLCGYSELTEIALLRAQEEDDIEVIGIYDPRQKSETRFGLPVATDIKHLGEHDALVLTTLKKPVEFLQHLNETAVNKESIFVPSVLGLSKDALN